MNNVDYELFNKRLEDIERSLKVLQAYVDTSLKEKYYGADGIARSGTAIHRRCVLEGMSPEDKMKPMSVYCSCPKCSPYALSVGSLVDSGLKQVWNQPTTMADCISTKTFDEGK